MLPTFHPMSICLQYIPCLVGRYNVHECLTLFGSTGWNRNVVDTHAKIVINWVLFSQLFQVPTRGMRRIVCLGGRGPSRGLTQTHWTQHHFTKDLVRFIQLYLLSSFLFFILDIFMGDINSLGIPIVEMIPSNLGMRGTVKTQGCK